MLTHLQKIVQEVNTAPSLQAALNTIVLRVIETISVSACMVYLLDQKESGYSLRAFKKEPKAPASSTESHDTLVDMVGRRATPTHLLKSEASMSLGRATTESYACLGVPIIHQRRVLGVLLISKLAAKTTFNQNEEAFLVTLSAQLAGVIAHAEAISRGNYPVIEQTDAKFIGVVGSPGVAIGRVVVMYPPADLHAIPERMVTDKDHQIEVFRRAVDSVRSDIRKVRADFSEGLQPEHTVLFDFYLQMLEDKALVEGVEDLIHQGHWAQGALKHLIGKQVAQFSNIKDSYLRERKIDIEQLGQQILAYLEKSTRPERVFPPDAVLIADNVSPAMMSKIPRQQLAGIVSVSGSVISHVAILARALDVPALMGTVDLPYLEIDGLEVIVDGYQGHLHLNPSRKLKNFYKEILARTQKFSRELAEASSDAGETSDHHRIRLMSNVNFESDVDRSLDRGAEGIGLYRTEFHFAEKDHFPTEEEQYSEYRRHMERVAPRDITIRTLDVGGDKSLEYFPIEEANPFLGWRGIRITLDHPEIFTVQVRAMLKAHAGLKGRLRILLPMISSVDEVKESKVLIERCYREVIEEDYEVAPPRVGVMIEVPAAACQIEIFARYVDFLSVGSNDLAQYVLAVDRNNPRVAGLYQELHPAVLRTLHRVALEARKAGIEVSVCGELAADPFGCVLLIGMGYDILSMNATSLPGVRWIIQRMSLKKAESLLTKALAMETPDTVDALMKAAFVESGLERILKPDVEMSSAQTA